MGLFTPKWLTDKDRTAKLEDENKLKKAYAMGENMDVRLTAVGKIQDGEFLYGILEEATPEEQKDWTEEKSILIRAVVERLRAVDRSLLIKGLARLKHYPNDHGRVQTIIKENLRDKELYEVLSICGNITAIWIVEGLEDQKILKKIFLEKGKKQERIWKGGTIHRRSWTSTDEEISILAAKKLKEKKLILQILKELSGDYIKGLTILRDKLSDDDLIAFPETIGYVKDQERLIPVIFDKSASVDLRTKAVETVEDVHSIYRVLKERKLPLQVMWAVVNKIDDQAILSEIMKEPGYSGKVKNYILYRKSFPQEFYIKVAWSNRNVDMRRTAIEKIEDKEELLRIREETDNETLKICACGRLGHKYTSIRSWDERARFGKGYRSHTLYQCRICGAEREEVYEHDS